MILRDLRKLVNKEKRKNERVKAAQTIATGIGAVAVAGVATGILIAPKSGKETREELKEKAVNTVEAIKDTVHKKVESVKDPAAHAISEVFNVIKDAHGNAEGVKRDIKDCCHEITQEIHKTAESVSNKLNDAVK